jgi:hypothetical protein
VNLAGAQEELGPKPEGAEESKKGSFKDWLRDKLTQDDPEKEIEKLKAKYDPKTDPLMALWMELMAMVLRTNKKITDWILDKTFGPKGGKPEEGASVEVEPSSDKPPAAAATSTLAAPADSATATPVVPAPVADATPTNDPAVSAVAESKADEDDEITPTTTTTTTHSK